MYCLTLIHRYMVQKENIKLTIVKLHCLNCKLFVEDLTGVAFGPPCALTLGIDFTAISLPQPLQNKTNLISSIIYFLRKRHVCGFIGSSLFWFEYIKVYILDYLFMDTLQ